MSTFTPTEYPLLPPTTGVYQFFNAQNVLLYIGKAVNLKKRVSDYFEQRTHSPRIAQMVPHISKIVITLTGTEQDALLLEQRLIQSLKPKYNIIFRDDKTYSYLCFSNHSFPRIYLHKDKYKPASSHFGPFTDQYNLHKTFEMLQKHFLLRTCSDSEFQSRKRPCVLYQTGHCSAPCVQKITQNAYQEKIVQAQSFLRGDSSSLLRTLQEKMHLASENLEFEKAIELRNKIHSLSALLQDSQLEQGSNHNLDIVGMYQTDSKTHLHLLRIQRGILQASFPLTLSEPESLEHQIESLLSFLYPSEGTPEPHSLLFNTPTNTLDLTNIIIPKGLSLTFGAQTESQQRLLQMANKNAKYASFQHTPTLSLSDKQKDLETLLEVSTPLNHIECFDISHFNAESPVAACVVYKNFQMQPKEHRIYNIQKHLGGDDYASISQAVARRYQNMKQEEFPDLILLDGGLGQLHAVQRIFAHLNLSIPLLAISKGRARKVGDEKLYYQTNPTPLTPGIDSLALQLLAHIRDEAHRYGIERNRKLVSEKRLNSLWDALPGVGTKKKEALKLVFQTTSNLRKASAEQLSKVPGISPKLAQSIHLFLQSLS